MIEHLKIKNFQSHKNTSIKFHKGVNVIIGDTDSGKTAILRALRFAIWNQPLGDRFRSRWGGDTEVKIKTNGHTITRIKTDHENKYLLDNEFEFKAFKSNIPDEIQLALNLNDTNIQYQLDGHYLLSKTAGEVATHFNKVTKLEAIDESRKVIQSSLSKNKIELDLKKEDFEKVEKDLLKYEYLEKAEIDLEIIEQLEREKFQITHNLSFLNKSLTRLYEIKTEIRKSKKFIQKEKQVNEILQLISKKKELDQQLLDLL